MPPDTIGSSTSSDTSHNEEQRVLMRFYAMGFRPLGSLLQLLYRGLQFLGTDADSGRTAVLRSVEDTAAELAKRIVQGGRGRGFDFGLQRMFAPAFEHAAVLKVALDYLPGNEDRHPVLPQAMAEVFDKVCVGVQTCLQHIGEGEHVDFQREMYEGARVLTLKVASLLNPTEDLSSAAAHWRSEALRWSHSTDIVDWHQAEAHFIDDLTRSVRKGESRNDLLEVTHRVQDLEAAWQSVSRSRNTLLRRFSFQDADQARRFVLSNIVIDVHVSGMITPQGATHLLEAVQALAAGLGIADLDECAISSGSLWLKVRKTFGTAKEWLSSIVRRKEVQEGAKIIAKDLYDSLAHQGASKRKDDADAKVSIEDAKLRSAQVVVETDPVVIDAHRREAIARADAAELDNRMRRLSLKEKELSILRTSLDLMREAANGGGYFHLSLSTDDGSVEVIQTDTHVARIEDGRVVEIIDRATLESSE